MLKLSGLGVFLIIYNARCGGEMSCTEAKVRFFSWSDASVSLGY